MATALRHVAAEGEVLPGPSLLWLQRHPPGAQSFRRHLPDCEDCEDCEEPVLWEIMGKHGDLINADRIIICITLWLFNIAIQMVIFHGYVK